MSDKRRSNLTLFALGSGWLALAAACGGGGDGDGVVVRDAAVAQDGASAPVDGALNDSAEAGLEGGMGFSDAALPEGGVGAQDGGGAVLPDASVFPALPSLQDSGLSDAAADEILDDGGAGDPCLTGGIEQPLTGGSACAGALQVDVSGLAVGEVGVIVVPEPGLVQGPEPFVACGESGRYFLALEVEVGPERDLQVVVAGQAGQDFALLGQFASEPGCDGEAIVCVDEAEAGACEILYLVNGLHFEAGRVRVFVSTPGAEPSALTLRFRVFD